VLAAGLADQVKNDAPTHHFTKFGDSLARRLQIEPTLNTSLASQPRLGKFQGLSYVTNAASANIFGWCGVVRLEPHWYVVLTD
jgi:hypothetical protein